jgi:NAD(P)H dehydrogenase (quinone)
MNVLIVFAHPERASFNGAMLDTAIASLTEAGHRVQVSDLYRMQFDPVSDRRNFTTVADSAYFKQQAEEMNATAHDGFAAELRAEQDKLLTADLLIFQFPLWWFGLPAILKGWVDRVLAMGKLYGGGRWYDRGVLSGRRALCALTTGGPATMFEPTGLPGDLHMLLYPVHHGMLYFVGLTPLAPFVVYGPARLSAQQRAAELQRWRQALLELESRPAIEYPRVEEYDATLRLKVGGST